MENHKHHDYDAASASAAIGKMPREDQAKAKDEDKDDHVMVLNLPNVAGLHSSAKDAQHVRNFAIWRFPAMEEALLHVQSQEIQTLLPYNGPYPERPGEKNCAYYMRTGLCKYGIACRFNHPAKISQITAPTEKYPERIGQPECQFYLKTGTCKFGATCKYHHPPNIEKLNPIQLNANGYPLRQGEKECPYYMRTGSCKYGQTCKFHHPEPTELPYPVSASALGNGSYISIFLSHPTVLPVQPKWRDRLGSRSPPSKQQQTETTTTIDGSEAVSGCDDYCASPSNSNSDLEKADEQNSACQGQQLQTRSCMVETETVFPERPGEPECQYYLKTGTCKYASNCKYHHPKDRISESSNCTYTDTGLPLRPDQPTCKFYSNYGICKFGPACKFHHPATHPIKS